MSQYVYEAYSRVFWTGWPFRQRLLAFLPLQLRSAAPTCTGRVTTSCCFTQGMHAANRDRSFTDPPGLRASRPLCPGPSLPSSHTSYVHRKSHSAPTSQRAAVDLSDCESKLCGDTYKPFLPDGAWAFSPLRHWMDCTFPPPRLSGLRHVFVLTMVLRLTPRLAGEFPGRCLCAMLRLVCVWRCVPAE